MLSVMSLVDKSSLRRYSIIIDYVSLLFKVVAMVELASWARMLCKMDTNKAILIAKETLPQ